MAGPGPLRALNCPNCGAPIDFPAHQSTVRCAFCSSVIDRSDDAPTSDDEGHALKINIVNGRVTVEQPRGQPSRARHFTIKMGGGQPMVIEDDIPLHRPAVVHTTAAPPPATASRAGGCVGWVLALVIGLAVLVPLGAALFSLPQASAMLRAIFSGDLDDALSVAPTLTTRIVVGRSGALVPAVSDAPPDVIMLTTQYPTTGGDGEQRLVAVSSASPGLLWNSAPLERNTYDAPIVANPDFVFTVSGARLLAIRRTDGSTAWEAPLEDQVSLSLCQGCVRLLGDRVFTLSDDGTLEAFDARTGQSLWDFQALQDSPRGLYVLDGRPAFMDEDEENDGVLRVFDPASGERHTVKPECVREDGSFSYTARWTTPLLMSPDGADFYLAFNSAPLCIQRWSAETLTQAWEARLPAGSIFSSDSPRVVTPQALYLTIYQELIRVDAATGQVTTLINDGDYQPVPLAVHDDALVVLTIRTRGSTRFELWTLETASGERRWKYDLGQDPPLLDIPHGNTSIIDENRPVWTWHPAADGLRVLRFKRTADDVSHAILLETLDWQTGASGGRQEILLGISTIILSAPDLFGWQGDTLWMSIERQLLGFDTASGEIVYRWP
jgi:outer membrane protein assembly factor BamB